MTLHRIRPDMYVVAVFSPVPGSYFHDWYKERGMILCEDFRHLARRGGAPQLKGVDYDFLDKLLCRPAAPGRAARAFQVALNAVGLLEPARRARRGISILRRRLLPGALSFGGRGRNAWIDRH